MSTRLLLGLILLLSHATAQARELIVSAAASLTEAFTEIGKRYESTRPDVRVLLNFGASGALLQQIANGAPVDVFASADQETMDRAQQQQLVAAAERHDFAGNALVVVVPSDSRLSMGSLQALADPGVARLAIGNPASVPVGRYAQKALKSAGLWTVVSVKAVHALNVRQALDYVARGEVDAAFVYATDARLMPDRVRIVYEVPTVTPIRYPIAPVIGSGQAEEARQFVDFVRSDEGQDILRRHGFQAP